MRLEKTFSSKTNFIANLQHLKSDFYKNLFGLIICYGPYKCNLKKLTLSTCSFSYCMKNQEITKYLLLYFKNLYSQGLILPLELNRQPISETLVPSDIIKSTETFHAFKKSIFNRS